MDFNKKQTPKNTSHSLNLRKRLNEEDLDEALFRDVKKPRSFYTYSEQDLDAALFKDFPAPNSGKGAYRNIIDPISTNDIRHGPSSSNSKKTQSALVAALEKISADQNLQNIQPKDQFSTEARPLKRRRIESLPNSTTAKNKKPNFLDLPPSERPTAFYNKDGSKLIQIPEILRQHEKSRNLEAEFFVSLEKLRADSNMSPEELSRSIGLNYRTFTTWLEKAKDFGISPVEWRRPYKNVKHVLGPMGEKIELPESIKNKKRGEFPNRQFLQDVVNVVELCRGDPKPLCLALNAGRSTVRRWRVSADEQGIEPVIPSDHRSLDQNRRTLGSAGPSSLHPGQLDERSRSDSFGNSR